MNKRNFLKTCLLIISFNLFYQLIKITFKIKLKLKKRNKMWFFHINDFK